MFAIYEVKFYVNCIISVEVFLASLVITCFINIGTVFFSSSSELLHIVFVKLTPK